MEPVEKCICICCVTDCWEDRPLLLLLWLRGAPGELIPLCRLPCRDGLLLGGVGNSDVTDPTTAAAAVEVLLLLGFDRFGSVGALSII
jgi:hypothetical protein